MLTARKVTTYKHFKSISVILIYIIQLKDGTCITHFIHQLHYVCEYALEIFLHLDLVSCQHGQCLAGCMCHCCITWTHYLLRPSGLRFPNKGRTQSGALSDTILQHIHTDTCTAKLADLVKQNTSDTCRLATFASPATGQLLWFIS